MRLIAKMIDKITRNDRQKMIETSRRSFSRDKKSPRNDLFNLRKKGSKWWLKKSPRNVAFMLRKEGSKLRLKVRSTKSFLCRLVDPVSFIWFIRLCSFISLLYYTALLSYAHHEKCLIVFNRAFFVVLEDLVTFRWSIMFWRWHNYRSYPQDALNALA